MRRFVASSRMFIALAAAGSFLSAMTLLVYGFLAVVEIVWDTIWKHEVSSSGSKDLAVEFIELTDVFLLGTVLYIVALGLYDLFVDATLPVPDWLHIRDLNDLKSKLIQVIVVLLGVTFLGRAVNWAGEENILEFGIAIALVIAALAVTTVVQRKPPKGDERRDA
jgi:uncharacterized membrane protein YqhA